MGLGAQWNVFVHVQYVNVEGLRPDAAQSRSSWGLSADLV